MKRAAVPIIVNGDMSSPVNSIGIDINQEFTWSIQAIWTGTPIGTLTIQVSNDIVPVYSSPTNPVGNNPAQNVVNWTTYSNSQVPINGNSGNWTYVAQLSPYRWVRLVYTPSMGSGTINANLFMKG